MVVYDNGLLFRLGVGSRRSADSSGSLVATDHQGSCSACTRVEVVSQIPLVTAIARDLPYKVSLRRADLRRWPSQGSGGGLGSRESWVEDLPPPPRAGPAVLLTSGWTLPNSLELTIVALLLLPAAFGALADLLSPGPPWTPSSCRKHTPMRSVRTTTDIVKSNADQLEAIQEWEPRSTDDHVQNHAVYD